MSTLLLPSSGSNPGGEMTFLNHIEQLRWHIIRSFIAVIVMTIAVFFNIEWIFDHIILGPAHPGFISYKALNALGNLLHIDALKLGSMNLQFQNTQLSGQFMMSFSSSFIIGFILSFPYVLWETWRFIRPALTQRELQLARGIVFWSSLLFFTGVLFAYYLIAPFTINFFAGYMLSPIFKNIITMSNYYDTLSDMVLGMGLVFQLPVVVFFLSKIGILTPSLMKKQRRYAIVIIMFLAAIITPPDWFSIWLVAIPLLGLYEISIRLSQRVSRNVALQQTRD